MSAAKSGNEIAPLKSLENCHISKQKETKLAQVSKIFIALFTFNPDDMIIQVGCFFCPNIAYSRTRVSM